MQLKFTQTCPCCQKDISFGQMFKQWNLASKNKSKALQCPYCQQTIGNMGVYEKYGLVGSIPLFALPLVYGNIQTAFLMAILVIAYVALLFYGLYAFIPLKCQQENIVVTSKESIVDNDDDKNNLIAVLLISLVFFISIFAIFAPLFSR